MQQIFEAINQVFTFIGPLSDFLWDFPTNFAWYQNIPILGNFSLAVILLLGSGIFFTFKLGFIQITQFKKGVKLIAQRKHAAVGISSGAAFFLSTAMRVGPGNIVGVTGAIAVGGPGALFWLWVAALLAMVIKMTEVTLAVYYREKQPNGEYLGGPTYYMQKGLGDEKKLPFWKIFAVLFGGCIFMTWFITLQNYTVSEAVGSTFKLPYIVPSLLYLQFMLSSSAG